MSSILHRVLTWSVLLGLFLPVVIVLLLGLAGLLAGMGDQAGVRFCVRVAIGLGVWWACSLVTTTVTAGITILQRPGSTPVETPTKQDRTHSIDEGTGR